MLLLLATSLTGGSFPGCVDKCVRGSQSGHTER